MEWVVGKISGEDGELVERLCYLLHGVIEQDEGTGSNILVKVAMCVGAALSRDEIMARAYDAIEEHVARRLLALIDAGMSESFLVRAVRDETARTLAEWTDVEAVNRRRAEAREAIGDQLSVGALMSLQPIDAEEATAGWAAKDYWTNAVPPVLCDGTIERFDRLRGARDLQEGGASTT